MANFFVLSKLDTGSSRTTRSGLSRRTWCVRIGAAEAGRYRMVAAVTRVAGVCPLTELVHRSYARRAVRHVVPPGVELALWCARQWRYRANYSEPADQIDRADQCTSLACLVGRGSRTPSGNRDGCRVMVDRVVHSSHAGTRVDQHPVASTDAGTRREPTGPRLPLLDGPAHGVATDEPHHSDLCPSSIDTVRRRSLCSSSSRYAPMYISGVRPRNPR